MPPQPLHGPDWIEPAILAAGSVLGFVAAVLIGHSLGRRRKQLGACMLVGAVLGLATLPVALLAGYADHRAGLARLHNRIQAHNLPIIEQTTDHITVGLPPSPGAAPNQYVTLNRRFVPFRDQDVLSLAQGEMFFALLRSRCPRSPAARSHADGDPR